MRDLTRRDALTGLVTAGALSVAGCVSQGSNQPDDGSANDPDGDGSNDNDPEVVNTSIESTASPSSTPDHDGLTTFSQNGTAVTTEGFLTAPDPCKAATVVTAALDGEELSLTISLEESIDEDNSSDDEVCPDVIARVDYTVTAELSDPVTVRTVSVDYTNGGSPELTADEVSNGDDGDDDDDEAPELVDSSIETTASDCGGADQASVSTGETTVSIDGVLPASNPCHEAVLTDVAVSGGQLTVSVGIQSTLGEDDGCIDCLGGIAYTAEVEITDATKIVSATVDHGNADTHEFDTGNGDDSRSGTESPVVETQATTIATSERGEEYDWATVERNGSEVLIEGVLPASHPHHRAFVGDASVDDGTLTVEIILRSTLDDEMGTQPLGQVEYEATVTLAEGASVDEIIVDHSTGGEH